MTCPRQRGPGRLRQLAITPLPDGQRRARSQSAALASGARVADAVVGSPDAAGPCFRRASGLLPGRPGTSYRLACVRGLGSGPEAAEWSASLPSASTGQSGWRGPGAELRPSRVASAGGAAGPSRRTRTATTGDASGRCAGEMPGPDRTAAGWRRRSRALMQRSGHAGCPHSLSPRCRDSGYRVKGKVPNEPVVAPAGNGPAARSRWSSAVCLRPDPLVRTAAASARREPASTTSFLALVTPV